MAKGKPIKKNVFVEAVGWYGVAGYILSYALVSYHFISVDSFIYQFMNLTGAIGLLTVSIKHKAYQPAVSNFLWAVIAFTALVVIFLGLAKKH